MSSKGVHLLVLVISIIMEYLRVKVMNVKLQFTATIIYGVTSQETVILY